MQLYLNTYGTYLRKSGNLFEVNIDGRKTKISPQRINGIVISNAVQISSDAVRLALEHNIDILFIDSNGSPYGRIWFPRLGRTASVRRRLLEVYSSDTGIDYVKKWATAKIKNQIIFSKRILEKRPQLKCDKELTSIQSFLDKIRSLEGNLSEVGSVLMGYEGNAGRSYFKILSEAIPRKHKFKGRSSQPAKDEFNAFLNYGYGILYGKVEKSLVIAGLDPYIGLLHRDNYNKPSLVYDFIEPYRILIEIPIFYLFSRRKIKDTHTETVLNGVKLSEQVKKFLIPHLMEYFEEKIRHRNQNMKRIQQIQADAHHFSGTLIDKQKD